ncbi:MAG: TIGR00296 family protein [Methanobacteriota archaeon]|nr:MAG: TIGR00296 family protein [Euryarchaeota archaeon]
MTMFSDDDGRRAVEIARTVVEKHVRRERIPEMDFPEGFREKSGVFVTLTTFPDDGLRGCIGYPEPVSPLIEALMDSAVSAASRDPRFDSVRPDELDVIRVEVSLLTPPKEITPGEPSELPGLVRVGEDGLIVQRAGFRGLLLPQVPVELGWDADEFLGQTCMKAGLSPDSWLLPDTKTFSFSAEVFSETSPRGKVVRRNLSERHGRDR